MTKHLRWAAVVAVAFLFPALTIDWVPPGEGTRLAVAWLDEGGSGGVLPLWGSLVRFVGKDIVALGWLSAVAGIVCVGLVSVISNAIFGWTAWIAEMDGTGNRGEFALVRNVGVFLSGLAFALTPGFLMASTRVSPLMFALTLPLAVGAAAVWFVVRGGDVASVIRRARRRWYLVLAVLGLLIYSVYEFIVSWRIVLPHVIPAVGVWLAVGIAPAVVIAAGVRRRWLVTRGRQLFAVGVWAAGVLAMGTADIAGEKTSEGRLANRLVARIIASAEAGEKAAVVSDGSLDELYSFMLPEKIKLITLAKERDPSYGRELAEWVREVVSRRGGSEGCDGEDLAFAAELGPEILIDEWAKSDKQGFRAAVLGVADVFPTRAAWNTACDELKDLRADEPYGDRLRHFLAVCGNALGCKRLEAAKAGTDCDGMEDAWAIFKAIVERIEPRNYAAHLNLKGMVERGYGIPRDEAERLERHRQVVEGGLKDVAQVVRAARDGGRVYVDPETAVRLECERRERAARRELSAEARAFVDAVAAASKDPKRGRVAQEAIHKAIREGKVSADAISGELIAIDFALGDLLSAERDAIAVLRLNRHDPAANAAMGALAGRRGDDARAERYLRRAIATGKASAAAKNDLAYLLSRRGRLDEAETFARAAVAQYGGHWALRETLAAILIQKGKIEEGEQELREAESLAEKAGLQKEKVTSFATDWARLRH